MKELKKKRNTYFAVALILSVLAVTGVPGIIFSAIHGQALTLTLSIIFVVAGFYVMPILWVKFGELKTPMRVLEAVEQENLYSTEEIASQLQIKEKIVVDHINYLIRNRYLQGYKFDGKTLTINENLKQVRSQASTKCPYCGASITLSSTSGVCPYCNSTVNVKK